MENSKLEKLVHSEGCELFRPRMDKFMERYEYLFGLNLPENQKIKPTTSIDYIKKYTGIE